MKNLFNLLLVALPLTLMTPSAQADIEIEGFYWMLEPSGQASIGKGTIVGSRFDLENDFGYGDSVDTPGLTVTFGGMNRLGISWLDLSADASKELELDVNFADLEFNTRSLVNSTIDAQVMRGFYRVGNVRGSFLGSGEIGVVYADFEASAAASDVGRTSAQADGATLYGGANAEMILSGNLRLNGSIRFSQFDIQGLEFKYVEYEIGGKYYLHPMYVGGGYRFLGLDGKEDGSKIDIDLEFAGPVIYAGFRF